jgi:hypothetical protein
VLNQRLCDVVIYSATTRLWAIVFLVASLVATGAETVVLFQECRRQALRKIELQKIFDETQTNGMNKPNPINGPTN